MQASDYSGMHHPATRIINCLLLIIMLASGIPLAFSFALAVTLALLGLPVERFALRLMLVLEITPRAQSLLRYEHGQGNKSAGRVKKLIQRLTAVYARIVEEADRDPIHAIQMPLMKKPSLREWLSPCLLIGLMIGITAAA